MLADGPSSYFIPSGYCYYAQQAHCILHLRDTIIMLVQNTLYLLRDAVIMLVRNTLYFMPSGRGL